MSNHGASYSMQRDRGELTSSTMCISLPKHEKEALRTYACERDWSMNEVVREAVKLYMVLRPPGEPA